MVVSLFKLEDSDRNRYTQFYINVDRYVQCVSNFLLFISIYWTGYVHIINGYLQILDELSLDFIMDIFNIFIHICRDFQY